jgi:hypothetical protein
MDVRGFQYILNCASRYRAALAISRHKSTSESSLPPANSNRAESALSLITYTIWIEAQIVCVGATKRRYTFSDVSKSVVQFTRDLAGNSIATLLRFDKRFRDDVRDCIVVKQEGLRGVY